MICERHTEKESWDWDPGSVGPEAHFLTLLRFIDEIRQKWLD